MTTAAEVRTQAARRRQSLIRTRGRRALQMDDRPPVRERAPTLVRRIERAHEEATGAARTAVQHAIECGRLLREAREQRRHGEWLAWVRNSLSFGVRQAQKYMRLAEHAHALPNANSGTHLSINEALELLAATMGTPAELPAMDPPAPARHPAARPSMSGRASQAAPMFNTAPDYLARLQDAIAIILELPEPEVLAREIPSWPVDLNEPLERAGQYIARLGIELRRR